MTSVITLLLLSLLIIGSGGFSRPVMAKTLWSDFSVTYLSGRNYELGDPKRQVVTFEYAAGTTWGNVFMFADRLKSANGDWETYIEFAPRVKFTEFDKTNVVQAVSAAAMIEIGENFTHYLVGIGTDIQVPGFSFVQVNFYRRNNEFGEDNWQITPVWGLPFALGDTQWLYSGFIDFVDSTSNSASGFNWTSQLAWNIGHHFDFDTPLYLGVEYVYWHNKFGVAGVDERNVNLLLKWHF